jgi:hypothetical protein
MTGAERSDRLLGIFGLRDTYRSPQTAGKIVDDYLIICGVIFTYPVTARVNQAGESKCSILDFDNFESG